MSTEAETQPQQGEESTVGGLLKPKERKSCEQIVVGKAPWSQRARALLALDEGYSEAAAAEQSGLRSTQVKYWLGAFRRKRTGIFPENLLKGIDFDSPAPDTEMPEEDAPAAKNSGKTKKSKKMKKAKGKKRKGSKKKKRKKSKGKKRKKKDKKKKRKKKKSN